MIVEQNGVVALSAMQAAYWVGRQSQQSLCGVAAHLYTEFDGVDIDPKRLGKAVDALYRVHPMLRVKISPQGEQSIAELSDLHRLRVENLSALTAQQAEQTLSEIRHNMSHQSLNLAQGQAADFRLTLLGEGRCRLHIDVDMIAADGESFRIIVDDLARLYRDPDAIKPAENVAFFEFIKAETAANSGRSNAQSRKWWQARLNQVSPAPQLPYITTDASAEQCQMTRLAANLDMTTRGALEQLAHQQGVTLSTLSLALFAQSMAKATGQAQFRLNVPMFYRPDRGVDVSRVVGDFARLMLLSVDIKPTQTVKDFVQDISHQLNQLISYSDYDGVNVMRDLSRLHGEQQSSPVVFTAGVNLSGKTLLSELAREQFGDMVWAISQGAQVTLDAQIAATHDGLLLNWDVRADVFEDGFIERVFHDFVARLELAAKDSSYVSQSAAQDMTIQYAPKPQPLNALQQAYLLGREDHMPLGGVAMHDFREYRAPLSVEALRQRLTELVGHYPLLRTRIDVDRLTSLVSDQITVNLEVLDVSHLTPEHAERQAQRLRDSYRQRRYDLSKQSPWHVVAVVLPDDHQHGDSLWVMTSFDALIGDGRAISQIISELFDPHKTLTEQPIDVPAQAASEQALQSAQQFWQQQLSNVSGAPNLPWRQPLESIRCADYRRQTLKIDKAQLMQLTRIGGAERLLQNSLLSAIMLEALALWSDEQPLCLGVPVAIPTPNQALKNNSTFVTVVYDKHHGQFVDRVAKLQKELLQSLEHLAFSGIDLNRHLLSKNGGSLALPVVMTNAMSWPSLNPKLGVEYLDGVTQTPQVAMDLRLNLDAERHLLISVDYAQQALEDGFVTAFLSAVNQAVSSICQQGDLAVTATAWQTFDHYQANTPNAQAYDDAFLARIYDNLYGERQNATALWHNGAAISYRELGTQVDLLRRHFAQRGLSEGDVVALCLPRSPKHIAATLACALSGLVWVPIDARSPQERLEYLLFHCQPQLIVSDSELPAPSQVALANIDELLQTPATNECQALNLAKLSRKQSGCYYLYTSGTTGKPKCVVVNNLATANVVAATIDKWQLTRRDVCMSVTPLHHDMSVFDLFGALSAGAALVVPDADQDKNALAWNQLVARHKVTIWCSVPAILEMLLACEMPNSLTSLRLIAQGGDYIKPKTIAYLRQHFPSLALYSLGGPTETTIWSIWHPLSAQDVAVIPYGQPLPGVQYYIVDEQLNHCPAYKVGRIVTAGVSLSLGYLQDGELSQKDFIQLNTPEGDTVRAFRTGDMGYYREDGTIIFATRINGYVKVRGVRVSLPDIEKELRQCPKVKEAIVIDYQEPSSGDTVIGAIYASEDGKLLPASEVRAFIKARLPVSHLPNQLSQIEQFALSANGKIDRQRAKADWLVNLNSPTAKPDTNTVSASAETAGIEKRFSGDYQPILSAYASALKVDVQRLTPSSEFVEFGLMPSHLKHVADQLNGTFDTKLKAMALARCKNAEQVKNLLFA